MEKSSLNPEAQANQGGLSSLEYLQSSRAPPNDGTPKALG